MLIALAGKTFFKNQRNPLALNFCRIARRSLVSPALTLFNAAEMNHTKSVHLIWEKIQNLEKNQIKCIPLDFSHFITHVK